MGMAAGGRRRGRAELMSTAWMEREREVGAELGHNHKDAIINMLVPFQLLVVAGVPVLQSIASCFGFGVFGLDIQVGQINFSCTAHYTDIPLCLNEQSHCPRKSLVQLP